jgi:hypothetical protein
VTLISGLECLDELRGLPFGGAAVVKQPPKPCSKKVIKVGMVVAVEDGDSPNTALEIHSESWQ